MYVLNSIPVCMLSLFDIVFHVCIVIVAIFNSFFCCFQLFRLCFSMCGYVLFVVSVFRVLSCFLCFLSFCCRFYATSEWMRKRLYLQGQVRMRPTKRVSKPQQKIPNARRRKRSEKESDKWPNELCFLICDMECRQMLCFKVWLCVLFHLFSFQ